MINVVGAIITNDCDEILIARRKEEKHLAGFWEFPGGKVEDNEDLEDSLRREILEELNIEIEILDYFGSNRHEYENITINLIIFKAKIIRGEFKLNDHDKIEWIKISDICNYNFAPADVPIVEKLCLG